MQSKVKMIRCERREEENFEPPMDSGLLLLLLLMLLLPLPLLLLLLLLVAAALPKDGRSLSLSLNNRVPNESPFPGPCPRARGAKVKNMIRVKRTEKRAHDGRREVSLLFASLRFERHTERPQGPHTSRHTHVCAADGWMAVRWGISMGLMNE